MYYLLWFIFGLIFCILVFLLLMVALGNKKAIAMMWWTGWAFLWFGIWFWWFLCIGFKMLNWIVGIFYEFVCAGILFLTGGRRIITKSSTKDESGSTKKNRKNSTKESKSKSHHRKRRNDSADAIEYDTNYAIPPTEQGGKQTAAQSIPVNNTAPIGSGQQQRSSQIANGSSKLNVPPTSTSKGYATTTVAPVPILKQRPSAHTSTAPPSSIASSVALKGQTSYIGMDTTTPAPITTIPQ